MAFSLAGIPQKKRVRTRVGAKSKCELDLDSDEVVTESLINPLNPKPSARQKDLFRQLLEFVCKDRSKPKPTLYEAIDWKSEEADDFGFAILAVIHRNRGTPVNLKEADQILQAGTSAVGPHFKKRMNAFLIRLVLGLNRYAAHLERIGSLPVPSAFMAAHELYELLQETNTRNRSPQLAGDELDKAMSSNEYLLARAYAEQAVAEYKEKFLAAETMFGVRPSSQLVWNSVPAFPVAEGILRRLLISHSGRDSPYSRKLAMDSSKELVRVLQYGASNQALGESAKLYLSQQEKSEKTASADSGLETWEMRRQYATSLSELGQHTEADAEFGKALREVVEEDIAFQRLFVPQIDLFSNIFRNAQIGAMDPSPEYSFQEFMATYHRNAVAGSLPIERRVWIVEQARRFSTPFRTQLVAFSTEKFIRDRFPDYEAIRKDYRTRRMKPAFAELDLRWAKHRTVIYFYYDESAGVLYHYIVDHGAVKASGSVRIPAAEQLLNRIFESNEIDAARLREISTYLWHPVENTLSQLRRRPSAEELVLVPHSFLFSVPFSALLESDGSVVGEKYRLVHRSNLASSGKSSSETPREIGYLFVYDPVPHSAGLFPQLPGAAKEIEGALGALGRSVKQCESNTTNIRCLTKKGAHEGNLKHLLSKARVVHFATHGFVLADNPGLSGLVVGAGGHEDGFLTADEIAHAVGDVEVLVLSSCDLGKGPILGDGVAGLLSILRSSGVKTVVLALWRVSDAVAPGVMKQFYKGLARGESVSQALNSAQLTAKKVFGQPLLWAPFLLYEL